MRTAAVVTLQLDERGYLSAADSITLAQDLMRIFEVSSVRIQYEHLHPKPKDAT